MSKARSMAYFGEGQGPIHLDNVRCSGLEGSLGECPALGQGEGGHDCRHSEDAGVICDYVSQQAQQARATPALSCGLRPNAQRRRRRIIGGDKSFRSPAQTGLIYAQYLHNDSHTHSTYTLTHTHMQYKHTHSTYTLIHTQYIHTQY